MADHQSANVRLLLVFFLAFACCFSDAFQFTVGGKDGWAVKPAESYNHWAERMRFQVNDTLFFKYKKGSDSVLEVDKADYDKCDTTNPIVKLEDGNSVFKFNRSGPFFFISGNKTNCGEGQKMIIVVMSLRHHHNHRRVTPPASAPSPSPAPLVEAPAPVGSPMSGEAPGPDGDGSSLDNSTTPGTPAGHHHSFATPAFTPNWAVLTTTVSLVLSVGFGGFIVSS